MYKEFISFVKQRSTICFICFIELFKHYGPIDNLHIIYVLDIRFYLVANIYFIYISC